MSSETSSKSVAIIFIWLSSASLILQAIIFACALTPHNYFLELPAPPHPSSLLADVLASCFTENKHQKIPIITTLYLQTSVPIEFAFLLGNSEGDSSSESNYSHFVHLRYYLPCLLSDMTPAISSILHHPFSHPTGL